MNSRVLSIRAISAEFATQFLRPFVTIFIITLLVILIVIGILTYFISPWWGLLAIPVLILCTIGLTTWLILRFIIARVSPSLTPQQKEAKQQLISKAQNVIETLQTPYFIIGITVILDLILRRKPGLIITLIQDSKSLQPDYETLQKLFHAENITES